MNANKSKKKITDTVKKQRAAAEERILQDQRMLKKDITLARGLGNVRAPVRRILDTGGRGDAKSKLARVIGNDGMSALNFALSPADFECTVGVPDGAMPRSIPLTLKMDFVMSSVTTNPTWNLAILSLPSIDFPCVCIGYQPGQNPWAFWSVFANAGLLPVVNEGSTSQIINYSGANWSVFVPNWGATQLETLRGPQQTYNAGAANFSWPPGYAPIPHYNSDGSTAVNNSVKSIAAITTVQPSSVQSWRCAGMSVTTTQSASAIANQGMVTCRPLSRSAKFGMQTSLHQGINDLTAGASVATLNCYASGPAYCLDNLPSSRSDLFAAEQAYVGKAEDGTYCVSRYIGGSKSFRDTDTDRGALVLTQYNPAAGGTERDADFMVTYPLNVKLNQGTGAASGVSVLCPLLGCIDENWTPTMTIYEGLEKGATVDVKVIMGVQCTATSNGPYASIGKIVAQPSLMYPSVLTSVMKEMPPGGPASDNWEWADVGRWIKTALSVVAAVAPFLIPLL